MARDIAINSERQTEYNERGDVRNSEGTEFITNRVFIAVNELVDLTPPTFNDTDIEEQRSNIESVVRRSQFTSQPIRVGVDDIDYDDQSITYSISTEQIDEIISTT